MNSIDNSCFPSGRVKRFQIKERYSSETVDDLKPLWASRIFTRFTSKELGRSGIEYVNGASLSQGAAYLELMLGDKMIVAVFDSLPWQEKLQEAFEPNIAFRDEPNLAAFALEAFLASEIDSLERVFGAKIRFERFSFDAPEATLEQRASFTFKVNSPEFPEFFISLLPPDAATQKMICTGLLRVAKTHRKNEIPISEIKIQASIMADVVELTTEDLLGMEEGSGFLIEKEWLETADFKLYAAGKNVAQLQREQSGYSVTSSTFEGDASSNPKKVEDQTNG